MIYCPHLFIYLSTLLLLLLFGGSFPLQLYNDACRVCEMERCLGQPHLSFVILAREKNLPISKTSVERVIWYIDKPLRRVPYHSPCVENEHKLQLHLVNSMHCIIGIWHHYRINDITYLVFFEIAEDILLVSCLLRCESTATDVRFSFIKPWEFF